MRDFFSISESSRLDQADGLRRMFGERRQCMLPLVSNPFVGHPGSVIERLAAAASTLGRHMLVVDAGEQSPQAHELARMDLTACVEPLTPELSYLAARGLPLAYVNTRGSASAFLDALADAAPQADVVLVHAPAGELARLFSGREARPMVLAADHPEGLKHAYACVKLLAQRAGLLTFDLLVVADQASPRVEAIAATLASCADRFVGGLLREWAHVAPAFDVMQPVSEQLLDLLQAQWELDGADMQGRTDHLGRGSAALAA